MKRWQIISVAAIVLLAVIVSVAQYRKSAAFKDRLACAATWLEKAKVSHDHHIEQASTVTDDLHQRLKDQIDRAYRCATRPATYLHSEFRDRPASGQYGSHPVQPH